MDYRLTRWVDDEGQLWQICMICTDPTRAEDLAIDPFDGERWDLCATCGEGEFNRLIDAFIRHLLPLIPDEYRDGFEYAMTGGEYSLAIADLAAVVEEQNVELTPQDAYTLRTLTERK